MSIIQNQQNLHDLNSQGVNNASSIGSSSKSSENGFSLAKGGDTFSGFAKEESGMDSVCIGNKENADVKSKISKSMSIADGKKLISNGKAQDSKLNASCNELSSNIQANTKTIGENGENAVKEQQNGINQISKIKTAGKAMSSQAEQFSDLNSSITDNAASRDSLVQDQETIINKYGYQSIEDFQAFAEETLANYDEKMAQIEEKKQEQEELQNQIKEKEDKLKDPSLSESEKKDLQGELDELTGKLETIETEIDELYNVGKNADGTNITIEQLQADFTALNELQAQIDPLNTSIADDSAAVATVSTNLDKSSVQSEDAGKSVNNSNSRTMSLNNSIVDCSDTVQEEQDTSNENIEKLQEWGSYCQMGGATLTTIGTIIQSASVTPAGKATAVGFMITGAAATATGSGLQISAAHQQKEIDGDNQAYLNTVAGAVGAVTGSLGTLAGGIKDYKDAKATEVKAANERKDATTKAAEATAKAKDKDAKAVNIETKSIKNGTDTTADIMKDDNVVAKSHNFQNKNGAKVDVSITPQDGKFYVEGNLTAKDGTNKIVNKQPFSTEAEANAFVKSLKDDSNNYKTFQKANIKTTDSQKTATQSNTSNTGNTNSTKQSTATSQTKVTTENTQNTANTNYVMKKNVTSSNSNNIPENSQIDLDKYKASKVEIPFRPAN